MARFILDLWLDGYENEKDMEEACHEFIYDQLNMTASGVTFRQLESNKMDIDELVKKVNELQEKNHV